MSVSVSVKLIEGGVEIDGVALRTLSSGIVYRARGGIEELTITLQDEKGRKCGKVRVRDGNAQHAVFFEPAGVVSKLSVQSQMQLGRILAERRMK